MDEFLKHLLSEFHLLLTNPVLVFALVLFIIMLEPILLRKFNIPGIIGLIISGVLIGPFGLNILDYDFTPSFLAASMFAAHTLVAYPIVSRLGVSKNEAAAITVGGSILTDPDSEMNIIAAKKELEEYQKHGAAAEVNINTIVTIALNATNGIERISKEIMADIIVLCWPKKPGIREKLIGEKIYSIINNVDKNLFISLHKKLLLAQKKIIVFSDWEDFLALTKEVDENDLLALVSARKNALSYQKYPDHIPSKLEKHFKLNDKIVIFPQQNSQFASNAPKLSAVSINR